jgi:pimeloyl-ACP methyl ester carboxylesterase
VAVSTITTPDGASISYDVAGTGPALVLVHGITESARSWEPLLAPLTAGHTVVTMDLRGHGRSSKAPTYDLAAMAGDLGAVITASGVGGDAILVGHSLGGAVVSAAPALGVQARAIVNVDQPLALAGFQEGLRQLEPMLRGDTAAFQAAIGMVFDGMAGELVGDERARVESLRHADQDVVLGVWAAVLESPAEALDAMVTGLAGAVTVPYLSLHGIDPGEGYAEWLTGLVPTATVEVWPGVGHYPHLVQPQRFLDRLAAFEASLS